MTPEKQDKTLELSKHWSVDSTPARNEVIMKRTYPVKSVKCDKICSSISVVKWGLCSDIQLTVCEGVWPHTISVGRQSGGSGPHRMCGGAGPHTYP